jgi:hypothetical protein
VASQILRLREGPADRPDHIRPGRRADHRHHLLSREAAVVVREQRWPPWPLEVLPPLRRVLERARARPRLLRRVPVVIVVGSSEAVRTARLPRWGHRLRGPAPVRGRTSPGRRTPTILGGLRTDVRDPLRQRLRPGHVLVASLAGRSDGIDDAEVGQLVSSGLRTGIPLGRATTPAISANVPRGPWPVDDVQAGGSCRGLRSPDRSR